MGLIEATPALKDDPVRGIMVGKFSLNYHAFDNVVASGSILLLFRIRYY